MSIISSGNSSLDTISNAYQSTEQEKAQKDDVLGMDSFLTMLVAQLQNQDPLNPMEGSDFSAQLAQFSQLEQLINLNDTLETVATSSNQPTEGDFLNYIGKQVTGKVDTMTVDEGTVSSGFYTLSQPADVMIAVTDTDGHTIKTLYDGQQNAGSHMISWDGTNTAGEAVTDGSYTYSVMANTGHGYVNVPSTVTGTVDGITYTDGKPYLFVQGVLLDPDALTAVVDTGVGIGSGSVDSALSYLGKTVSSTSPIVLVEEGGVSGTALTFNLEDQADITLTVYDAFNEKVKTISLAANDTVEGENMVPWDGGSDSGYKTSDGVYYYTVKADSGFVRTPVSEEVSGIKVMNGSQYLVLKDTGRLVAPSSVIGIN
ncbi:FlgD immunoglobulin-like domain containing protein [Desulfobacula sp.]|uniref:FlgD immunoglobulin-like domain containing protein n=1 Tax=Desulfobacula sp. TaxID=2593537 RepID=UPI0026157EF1|nr:FlgD immunoglobulin-like domain containing protein [Desulfobacula sp.]